MSVWLAFIGGASICSASEPYSYNGLRNRIVGTLRPSFWACGGHRRRAPSAPRALPPVAILHSIVLATS